MGALSLSQLYRYYPSSSPYLCFWATLNKCSTAQSFSSRLKYHCTRKESQMALHQRWDKHSFLSLPFIPIHLRVCVHKYMRFTAALCSRGSNERNLLCYRAVAVMHTMLRRNFTFTETRFSPKQSGRCVKSDNCIEIEPTTATETSF